MNVLWHLVNVVLLFWVLQRATGYRGRSFVVAALFAVHPLNVESVAWISERKTTLSMVFFLLALAAYRWYAREPRVSRYLLVAWLFLLGLMAKPQVITLPFVLLLWDYWPLGRMFAAAPGADAGRATPAVVPPRSLKWLIWEKAPLGLIIAADSLITMKAQGVGRPAGWYYTFGVRLANAIVSYARYVEKMFWPSRLALLYPHPGNSLARWQVARRTGFPAGHHRGRRPLLAAQVSDCGLALVSGDHGADGRPGAGGHGKPWPTATPIFLSSDFSSWFAGRQRNGPGRRRIRTAVLAVTTAPDVACADRGHASPVGLLARQRQAVVAYAGSDRPQ